MNMYGTFARRFVDRSTPLATLLVVGYLGCLTCLLAAPQALAAAGRLDAGTAASGLKEALQVGTGRAVELLGQVDGYLKNPEVRIPIPETLNTVTKGLRKLGLDHVVDEFEISMNRAAETAAPLARDVFFDTVRQMSFDDAVAIVRGSEHAATDYLAEHGGPRLVELFRPIVGETLESVGTTRAFNGLMERAEAVPFMKTPALDLDEYVTGKAVDGLFVMIAKEEEKIRKDPLARTTDLLKSVFGGAAEEDGKKKQPWWKRVLSSDG